MGNYDVSGTVSIHVVARQVGLHKQCFGFAPVDNMYPDGFCLTFYVSDLPVVQYVQQQVVTQGSTVVVPLTVFAGTHFNRNLHYRVTAHCVRNCGTAYGYAKYDRGTKSWSLVVTGSDKNVGDSTWTVIATDRYNSVPSYPITVRTVRPGQGVGNTCDDDGKVW